MLCQWPRSPSEILKLSTSGIDPAVCLDFDLAFVTWWNRFEDVANERVAGRDTSPKLKKGQTMVPKHDTLGDVFAAMYREMPTSSDPAVARIDLAKLAAAIDSESEVQF